MLTKESKPYSEYEYYICHQSFVAITNDDYSALTDTEEEKINDFLQTIVNEHGDGHFSMKDDNFETDFAPCDIHNCYSDVVTVLYTVFES